VYNIFDLLGDIGGLIEALIIVSGFFLTKISEYYFNIELIQNLFMAETRDNKIFNAQKTIFDSKKKPRMYMKKEHDVQNKKEYSN